MAGRGASRIGCCSTELARVVRRALESMAVDSKAGRHRGLQQQASRTAFAREALQHKQAQADRHHHHHPGLRKATTPQGEHCMDQRSMGAGIG